MNAPEEKKPEAPTVRPSVMDKIAEEVDRLGLYDQCAPTTTPQDDKEVPQWAKEAARVFSFEHLALAGTTQDALARIIARHAPQSPAPAGGEALREALAMLERVQHIAMAINDPALPLDAGKRLGMIAAEIFTFQQK